MYELGDPKLTKLYLSHLMRSVKRRTRYKTHDCSSRPKRQKFVYNGKMNFVHTLVIGLGVDK